MSTLVAPVALAPSHDLEAFDSGVLPLDEWLKRRARANEAEGASRTFVLCEGPRVIGYYSLAVSSLMHANAIGKVRRNMPDPVPAILLGRLAIDIRWQGKGLGADLLRDAVLRAASAAATIGVRAILVHAVSETAKAFHERHGFRSSAADSMTLMITVEGCAQSAHMMPAAAKA